METFMKSEELGSIYIWKPLIWTDGNNVACKGPPADVEKNIAELIE